MRNAEIALTYLVMAQFYNLFYIPTQRKSLNVIDVALCTIKQVKEFRCNRIWKCEVCVMHPKYLAIGAILVGRVGAPLEGRIDTQMMPLHRLKLQNTVITWITLVAFFCIAVYFHSFRSC